MGSPGTFLVLSAKKPDSKPKEYHRRKQYTKDRLGCLTCKQRRIKCDKAKPVCTRCLRADRECQYVQPTANLDPNPSPFAISPHSWPAALAESVLAPHIRAAGITTLPDETTIGALMSHTADDLGRGCFLTLIPLNPALWELSCQHHHLLASVLAVSACHLGNHAPDPVAHRMAESSLTLAACSLFRSAVSQTPTTTAESDALLLTAMMLNTLAFAAVENVSAVEESWVFSADDDRLSWLSIQFGLRPLLMATSAFRSESLLQPVFAASVFVEGKDDSIGSGWEDTSSVLAQPMSVLRMISRLPPSEGNLFRYVQFIGMLEPEFLQLLYSRDEDALWMFGVWFGLIGRLPGMWWFRKRVSRDRAAIWRFLHEKEVCEREGEQGVLWRLRMDEYLGIPGNDCLGE